jgi:hypothetical protein
VLRRNLLSGFVAAGTLSNLPGSEQQPATTGGVVLERPLMGQLHKGKVLLALQAHRDDIALEAPGTVARLSKRATRATWCVQPTMIWATHLGWAGSTELNTPKRRLAQSTALRPKNKTDIG